MRGDKTSRGSPTPGPTGSTWALDRSDERRAQQGAPSLKPVGTDPKTGLLAGIPYGQVRFNPVGLYMVSAVLPDDVSEVVVLRRRLHSVGPTPSIEVPPVVWSYCLGGA